MVHTFKTALNLPEAKASFPKSSSGHHRISQSSAAVTILFASPVTRRKAASGTGMPFVSAESVTTAGSPERL